MSLFWTPSGITIVHVIFKMSSPAKSARTRAATRRQPTPIARRRASAARRAASSSEEQNSNSSGKKGEEEKPSHRASKRPRRAVQKKQGNGDVASSEPDDAEQIQNECAVIDAVCAAADAAIAHAPRCPRVQRATISVKSAARFVGGSEGTTLCEVGERLMMSFLPMLLDRLKAESVCKRWRHMSVHEVVITELDFDKVVLRSVTKKHVIQILQRASAQLKRLALPDMRIDDAIIQSVVRHADLRVFRAHRSSSCILAVAADVSLAFTQLLPLLPCRRMQKKHVFQLLDACTHLEVWQYWYFELLGMPY